VPPLFVSVSGCRLPLPVGTGSGRCAPFTATSPVGNPRGPSIALEAAAKEKIMAWTGRKKIAFVPVYRPHAAPPDLIPADWTGDILRRVLFDPDARTGADRSLRAYIHKASSGRADLDAVVMPVVVVDQQDVPVGFLEAQLGESLRDQGFDAAALVMLGGPGAGTGQQGGFWARFVMVERLGTWAMELMHVLANFTDIRSRPGFVDSPNGEGDIGAFDEMAFNRGTHPTAYTKTAIGWLDSSATARHKGRAQGYALHAVGLLQPPPSGRTTGVRIGTTVPYLMVEARLMVDPFESPSQLESGIPSQGVIVYRVQTSDPTGAAQNNRIPLFLLTPSALGVGQSVVSDTNVAISVTGAIPGGLLVVVDDRNAAFETGQLLFYRDWPRDGSGDVNTPAVIGLGGWQQFIHLFGGDSGIIYAVNPDGRLLFYRDWHRDGTGDVSSPSVIGQGGWQQMRHLFSGGNGILYAVNPQGQLLFYRDATQNGTGDIANPSVIGQGGWQQMKHLFSGGNGIIYAVNDQGQLLFYRDTTQNGTGDVANPSVIGQGGWQQMKHLFSGGNGIIYAVDEQGRLLFYRDAAQNGTGDVANPSVIGQGGWQQFKFLFHGGDGILYAVPA
jgi:hypothetical protein